MLNYAVIGTGDTGLSIINYLCYKQFNLKKVFDTRTNPPNIQKIENILSNCNLAVDSVGYHFGTLNYLDFINIDVVVLNRSKEKLGFFKNNGIKAFSFEDFDFKNNKFDLVVNSTSAGLKDDLLPTPKEILENILSKSSFAFDCIYGKTTPFLALAKNLYNKIKDGEDMLLYQGVLAFKLFTNEKADNMVIEAMRRGLKGE